MGKKTTYSFKVSKEEIINSLKASSRASMINEGGQLNIPSNKVHKDKTKYSRKKKHKGNDK